MLSTNRFASSSTRSFNARIAFGRNQSAPMARTTRCCGSSMWISVLIPTAACCSSASSVMSTGRGELVNSVLSRSIAMMSACLMMAQNGRYDGTSTHDTGAWTRKWVSATWSFGSSA